MLAGLNPPRVQDSNKKYEGVIKPNTFVRDNCVGNIVKVGIALVFVAHKIVNRK